MRDIKQRGKETEKHLGFGMKMVIIGTTERQMRRAQKTEAIAREIVIGLFEVGKHIQDINNKFYSLTNCFLT